MKLKVFFFNLKPQLPILEVLNVGVPGNYKTC